MSGGGGEKARGRKGVVMAKKSVSVEPAQLDVSEAERAFLEVRPELERLVRDSLLAVRVDLQLVSAIAYSVAMRDGEPGRRARLAAINGIGGFDTALLDGLVRHALAAWHVRRRQIQAVDEASSARVAEPELKEAQQIRARMLRVVSYHCEDSDAYGHRIAAIRTGSGYVDLANDLLSLAELYEEPEVKALIAQDPSHYRETDPRDARQRAQLLFEGLGILREGEAARWTDLAQRAWTLLYRDYESLRLAGQLVFRNDEDVELSYPSLIAAVRAPASRTQAAVPEPAPTPGEPEPPPSEPAPTQPTPTPG